MEVDGVPERPVQSSFWNNMTIGLEVFNGSESEWLTELATVVNGIRDDEGPFVASMLTALKAERGRFNVRNLSDSDRRYWGRYFFGSTACQSHGGHDEHRRSNYAQRVTCGHREYSARV
jgi:hypothetical protein